MHTPSKSADPLDVNALMRRLIVQRAFVAPVREAIAARNPERALRLAAAAYLLSDDPGMALDAQTEGPARYALWRAAAPALAAMPKSVFGAPWRAKPAPRLGECAFDAPHAALSANGERLVTVAEPHDARLWDVQSRALLGEFRHPGLINALITPDGARVATVGHLEDVKLWTAEADAEPYAALKVCRGRLYFAALSRDGTRLLTLADSSASLWAMESGERLGVFAHRLMKKVDDRVVFTEIGPGKSLALNAARISPDNARVLTAGENHSACLWDAASGALLQVFTGHDGPLMDADFSPDGRRVVSKDKESVVRLWDAETGEALHVLRHGGDWTDVMAFSPDGARLLTANKDGVARIWDVASGAESHRLDLGEPGRLRHAAFTPDGATVVACFAGGVSLWRSDDGAPLGVLAEPEGAIYRMALSGDGAAVLTAGAEGRARIWRRPPEPLLRISLPSDPQRFEYSRDGALIMAAVADAVHIVDARQGGLRHRFAAEGGADDLRLSADGRMLAVAAGGRVRLWDLESGAERLNVPEPAVAALWLSADGARLQAASEWGVRAWEIATGAELWEAPISPVDEANDDMSVAGVAFSRAGGRVMCWSGHRDLFMFDAKTGARLFRATLPHLGSFEPIFSPDGRVVVQASGGGGAALIDAQSGAAPPRYDVERDRAEADDRFSPDGALFAAVGADGRASIFDLCEGAEAQRIDGADGLIRSARFSPDGRRLATSAPGAVRLWHVASGAALMRLPKAGGAHGARFSPDGAHLLTVEPHGLSVWDVRLSHALAADPPIALAAALSNGAERRSAQERDDMLLQLAPDDLRQALLAAMDVAQRRQVEDLARDLRAL